MSTIGEKKDVNFEEVYQALFNRLRNLFGLDDASDEETQDEKTCDCENCNCEKCENEIPAGALVEKKSLFDVFTEKSQLFKDAEFKADKLEKSVDTLSDFFVNCVTCALNDSDERRKFFKELYDSTLDVIEGVQFDFAVIKEDDAAYEILKEYINPNVEWATQCAFIIRTADLIEDKLASEFSKCPDFHVDLVMYPTKFGDIRNTNGGSFAWTKTDAKPLKTMAPRMDANILDEERLREMKDDNVYHVILKLLFK